MLKFNLIRDKVLAHQPARSQIDKWLRKSLQKKYATVILSISFVSEEQSQELNYEYRGINKPTNVISLEYASTRDEFGLLSGELILCDEVIVREALEQSKPILAHYAHMLVHGALHLQGYDHVDENDAEMMESIEINLLQKIGFENPYL
ncbi:MAG: rRNA maturation RNase YbeY [Burkholderiales bacterium]|jgi:probable rRNA maturation factor|nr:rRNA maturation RNase YbeY [Burkholderiales bacterium]